MAYLALYRMFRPSTLNDVVRQEHIVTVLKNQTHANPRLQIRAWPVSAHTPLQNCVLPSLGAPHPDI